MIWSATYQLQLAVRYRAKTRSDERAYRAAAHDPREQILLKQGPDKAKMKLAERCPAREEQRCLAVCVPSLSEKLKFTLSPHVICICHVNSS